jgi:hypothetical protein
MFDQSGYVDGTIGLIRKRKRETKKIEQKLFFVLFCTRNIAAWSCKNYCKYRLSSVTRNEWEHFFVPLHWGQNVSIATHLWVLPADIHLGLLARIYRQGFARNQYTSHLAGRT